jgi:phospholipase D1/2
MVMLLKEGYNCWKIEKASRATVVVDAADYFDAFARAAVQAQHSIFIVGWDLDTRIRLRPSEGFPVLSDFLKSLVRANPGLNIYILIWDFTFIYYFERQSVLQFKKELKGEPRIHLHCDSRHPLWASHHQKIICIDDDLAFVGGLDLTQRRWDTREHFPHDERRLDPGGETYIPFHDIQMAVQGDAAKALGDLARARWYRTTRQWIPPHETNGSLWPENLPVDFKNIPLAIARTAPLYKGEVEIRENEKLFLDSIKAANKYIYIENQYFTSQRIASALKEKLKDPEGPDIVLLVPCANTGAFEAGTMEVLRGCLLREMRVADKYGRFRAYYPLAANREVPINLHSKIFIADDLFLIVGSSNLNDRSTGVDTECDVALEAQNTDSIKAIREIRNRLLAEHLGVSVELINLTIRKFSLIESIEKLNSTTQKLEKCPDKMFWVREKLSGTAKIWDTARPLALWQVLSPFVVLALLLFFPMGTTRRFFKVLREIFIGFQFGMSSSFEIFIALLAFGLIVIAVLGSWERKSV